MKPAARELDRFTAKLPAAIRAVLLYGPDQGLVGERSRLVRGQWLDDVDDPMALTDLTADAVRQDPARLADETQAYSMLGGRRLVRVADAGDGITAAVKAVLGFEALEAPLLVEARELQASSSLRKLFEQAPNAAAIPCYRAEGQQLTGLIRERLDALGLEADHDALDHLSTHLGADRAILSRELEKLDLYLGERRTVRLEDAEACIGDSSMLELDALLQATGQGQPSHALGFVDRLLAQKQTAVGIVRALQNHYRRLWSMAIELEAGKPMEVVLDAARPRLFFRAKPAFQRALQRRPAAALRTDLAALVEAERQCKTTGLPAELICRRVVLRLAAQPSAVSSRRGP